MIIVEIKKFLTKFTPVISVIIPKKKKLWVFGCWFGRLYSDNAKYLFEYINKSHPDIECVWLTRNYSVKQEVEKRGYKCYKRFSLKGLLCALRAEVAFTTSDEIPDLSPFINRNHTKVVQLYHGIAGKGTNIYLSKKDAIDTRKRFNKYYWISTSNKYSDVFSKGFGIDRNRLFVTGYPRNDTFVTKPYSEKISEIRLKFPNSKMIIYMPTHRGYGKRPIDVTEFGAINEKLKEHNILMVYKPHYMELKNVLKNGIENYTNIIIAHDQEIWGDPYEYIHNFDLLISDYSSIVYDFLCADKPIVLYTYDLEYMRINDFGIMDYYETNPPGPFCYSWEETLNQVVTLLENDIWHEKRNTCREMFHPFDDGKNSERVYNLAIKVTSK